MADFGQFFRCMLKSFEKHLAIINGDEKITYGEFDRRTNMLAHALLDIGIERGDNIGIAEYNTPAFLEVIAAAWKITARAVTLNFKFKEWELEHVIEDAGMTAIFFDQDMAERMVNLRPRLPGVKNLVIIGDLRVDGMLNYPDLLRGRPSTEPRPPWEDFRDSDIVVLMYTGGTTGYPKGVIYAHDQLLSAALEALFCNLAAVSQDMSRAPREVFEGIERMLGIRGTARILPWLLSRDATRRSMIYAGRRAGSFIRRSPPFLIRLMLALLARLSGGKVRMVLASPMLHAWAYNFALMGMIGGFTSILLPSKGFDVKEMLLAIEKHSANILVAVGDGQCRPMADELDRAAEEGRQYDLGSLLVILSSGMALSVDVKKRLLHHLPQLTILDMLASTEGNLITLMPYTAADEEIEKTVFKVSETVKVVDEEGRDVKPGEVGELAVARLYQGSSGYYGDAEKSARTYRKIGERTYIFTGDMGMVDSQGRIHLIGRGSGCINTGGEKVFPEEVEEILNQHPGVELSGVTSVPHKRWGEAVTAVIQPVSGRAPGEDEIKAWCKERLADYKAPKYVLFVDELPRLITGKVHYREIKKLMMRRFGEGAFQEEGKIEGC